jgi:hypothetical protein
MAIIDGKTCTCEPTSGSFEIRDPHCPLDDDQHRRQREHEKAYWGDKKESRRRRADNTGPVQDNKGDWPAYRDSVDDGAHSKIEHNFVGEGTEHDEDGDHNFVDTYTGRRRESRNPKHYDQVGHEHTHVNDVYGSPELMKDEGDHQGVHDYYRGIMEEPPVGYARRDRSPWEAEASRRHAGEYKDPEDEGYHADNMRTKDWEEALERGRGRIHELPPELRGRILASQEFQAIARIIQAEEDVAGLGAAAQAVPGATPGISDIGGAASAAAPAPVSGVGGAAGATPIAPANTAGAPAGAAPPAPVTGPAAGIGSGASAAPSTALTAAVLRYANWCLAMRMRPHDMDTLERYAAKRSDREYFILADAISSQRKTAAPNYLQKADEALTNLLNQKAEEFQNSVQALQQALVTVQQAEALEQAANPLNVQPPAGTVNVMPGGGGDPSQGGGDAGGAPVESQAAALTGMGGGDPSQQLMARRGRRPLARNRRTAGEYDDESSIPWPKDLAHHLKGDPARAGYDAGYDASWHPAFRDDPDRWGAASDSWYNAGGRGKGFDDGWIDSASDIPHKFNDPKGHQEYFAQRGARRASMGKGYGRKCPECRSVNTDYSSGTNDYDCYDCGVTFKPYSNNSKKSPEKKSSRGRRQAGDYHDNANTFDRHDPPDPHAERCQQCGGQGGRHAHYCDVGGDSAYRNSSRGRRPLG